jgi:hypothetical protein
MPPSYLLGWIPIQPPYVPATFNLVRLSSLTASPTTFSDLTAGVTYYFVVSATNSGGTIYNYALIPPLTHANDILGIINLFPAPNLLHATPRSSSTTTTTTTTRATTTMATTLSPIPLPNTFNGLVATPQINSIDISLNYNPALTYTVYVYTYTAGYMPIQPPFVPATFNLVRSLSLSGSPTTVSNLTAGVTYYFVVSASNSGVTIYNYSLIPPFTNANGIISIINLYPATNLLHATPLSGSMTTTTTTTTTMSTTTLPVLRTSNTGGSRTFNVLAGETITVALIAETNNTNGPPMAGFFPGSAYKFSYTYPNNGTLVLTNKDIYNNCVAIMGTTSVKVYQNITSSYLNPTIVGSVTKIWDSPPPSYYSIVANLNSNPNKGGYWEVMGNVTDAGPTTTTTTTTTRIPILNNDIAGNTSVNMGGFGTYSKAASPQDSNSRYALMMRLTGQRAPVNWLTNLTRYPNVSYLEGGRGWSGLSVLRGYHVGPLSINYSVRKAGTSYPTINVPLTGQIISVSGVNQNGNSLDVSLTGQFSKLGNTSVSSVSATAGGGNWDSSGTFFSSYFQPITVETPIAGGNYLTADYTFKVYNDYNNNQYYPPFANIYSSKLYTSLDYTYGTTQTFYIPANQLLIMNLAGCTQLSQNENFMSLAIYSGPTGSTITLNNHLTQSVTQNPFTIVTGVCKCEVTNSFGTYVASPGGYSSSTVFGSTAIVAVPGQLDRFFYLLSITHRDEYFSSILANHTTPTTGYWEFSIWNYTVATNLKYIWPYPGQGTYNNRVLVVPRAKPIAKKPAAKKPAAKKPAARVVANAAAAPKPTAPAIGFFPYIR